MFFFLLKFTEDGGVISFKIDSSVVGEVTFGVIIIIIVVVVVTFIWSFLLVSFCNISDVLWEFLVIDERCRACNCNFVNYKDDREFFFIFFKCDD